VRYIEDAEGSSSGPVVAEGLEGRVLTTGIDCQEVILDANPAPCAARIISPANDNAIAIIMIILLFIIVIL
jgi:hypothetical protein